MIMKQKRTIKPAKKSLIDYFSKIRTVKTRLRMKYRVTKVHHISLSIMPLLVLPNRRTKTKLRRKQSFMDSFIGMFNLQ